LPCSDFIANRHFSQIAGGIAEAEKRIQKGDIITTANSDSLANISIEECAALMKSYQGKVALKILRPKPKSRDLK
jgi:C-terminal processing protease CtpA/Prc